jgi:hypothetical protein
VEGGSVRGIARLVDVSPVTVLRYLELAGRACAIFHNENVRNVTASLREARFSGLEEVPQDRVWSVRKFASCRRPHQKAYSVIPRRRMHIGKHVDCYHRNGAAGT